MILPLPIITSDHYTEGDGIFSSINHAMINIEIDKDGTRNFINTYPLVQVRKTSNGM